MRVFAPRHRYHHCEEKDMHHGSKKSRKIAKKMAKLEYKLCKYGAAVGGETANDYTSSRDSSRCRSRSRSRDGCRSRPKSRGAEPRRMCRRFRGHGKRFASHGGSSSSGSSPSDSSDSRSSSSSRSPSPPALPPSGHRHRRHHPRHEARRSCRRHFDGIQAYIYKLLSQSEPNLQEDRASDMGDDVEAHPDQGNHEMEDSEIQFVDAQNHVEEETAGEANEEPNESAGIDAALADHWKKIVLDGLSSDVRSTLLKKYTVSENRQILKAPKLNAEIFPVATEAAIKNDCILLCEQNQIGSGLFAMSQAISHLSENQELKTDKNVSEALEKLNDSADILLNAHRELSKARKLIMLPALKKGTKSVLEHCKTDDLLFGRDLAEKVKDSKYFKKNKSRSKGQKAEGKSEAGKKRKHVHHDAKRRTSKRLDLSGLSIKSS